ncbi:MAG: leucine-rich repeat protein [Oscillospiraceae bacterium]|nr:leucine-rich repeat protein [Oscillospiraceae bacterium]
MKKCPYCEATIQDHARFCLYCMRSLNEKQSESSLQKKKPWWVLVLLILVIATVGFILGRKDKNPSAEVVPEQTMIVTQPTETEDASSDAFPQEEIDEPGTEGTQSTEQTHPVSHIPPTTANQPEPEPQKPTTTQPTTTQPTTTQPATTQPATTQPTATSPVDTPVATLPQETISPQTQEPTQAETQPVSTKPSQPQTKAEYTYRSARVGDDFSAQYSNSGNDIVITGVAVPSANGVYDIPAYIDGQKVIAIVANAFYGSNATTVYIPSTVKTIWNYAFNSCPLQHIYFRGTSIYVESKAFSGALTIHCSSTCNDRNFRYYKNCAASYGATWKEWIG